MKKANLLSRFVGYLFIVFGIFLISKGYVIGAGGLFLIGAFIIYHAKKGKNISQILNTKANGIYDEGETTFKVIRIIVISLAVILFGAIILAIYNSEFCHACLWKLPN